jgi:6-pyruvoyltetrahydropterin/6-carboxytetrahydropterin synthase
MTRISTIKLYKENMKFSVAHFTIFSATHRENLHGHNYAVSASITAQIPEEGLSFDYRFYKKKILAICSGLTESVLLPTQSKFLRIEEQGDYYCAHFDTEKILFLKRDVTLVPITNITVEELTTWFIAQLTADKEELARNAIQAITIEISTSPGQSGSTTWTNTAALTTPAEMES